MICYPFVCSIAVLPLFVQLMASGTSQALVSRDKLTKLQGADLANFEDMMNKSSMSPRATLDIPNTIG